MKQGNGTIDANALASGRGLSSGSPSVAPVWSTPTTVKTSVGSTGSYIPSYTSWYPTAHQESMQQSQLMWKETSALDSAVDGAWALSVHADGTQLQQQLRRFAAAKTKTEEETEKTAETRGAPKGNASLTLSGSRRQMDLLLAALHLHSVTFLFSGWKCNCVLFSVSITPVCYVAPGVTVTPNQSASIHSPMWTRPQGEGVILNQISGLQILPSGCWNHSAQCARPQPHMLFICYICYLI